MKKFAAAVFGLVLVLVVMGTVVLWLDGPRRTTERFVGHMYHQRYLDAASMLQRPSDVTVEPDGGLLIVDRTGRSIGVPKIQLPFVVGGHDHGSPEDYDVIMTALGPSTNGILHDPPVAIYLRVVGDELTIESMVH